MSDVREQILARLLVVCRSVKGITGAYRNPEVTQSASLPLIAVYDGSEEADEDDPRRSSQSPRRVTMSVQVWAILGSEPENVGTQMNLYRARIIKAVLNDATLQSLTGTSAVGDVRYTGCATHTEAGTKLFGQMRLDFALSYILRASDL